MKESELVKLIELKEMIKRWLPNFNSKAKLIYRASTHGNSAKIFHEKCDN